MSAEASELHVRMGEVALARGSTVLKATLGSCVGIALIWRAHQRFALAHCLLPQAPQAVPALGARYVDQGIAALLRLLKVQPEAYGELEAHLAGGANMSRRDAQGHRSPMVGQLNAEAALTLLASQGIAVHSQDLGGSCARQVCLNPRDATFRVVAVPSPLGRSRRACR